MSPAAKGKIEEMSYEKAFAELESIVARLEEEQQPLDETLTLYERGQELARHCAGLLEKAELKVKQLSGEEITSFEGEE